MPKDMIDNHVWNERHVWSVVLRRNRTKASVAAGKKIDNVLGGIRLAIVERPDTGLWPIRMLDQKSSYHRLHGINKGTLVRAISSNYGILWNRCSASKPAAMFVITERRLSGGNHNFRNGLASVRSPKCCCGDPEFPPANDALVEHRCRMTTSTKRIRVRICCTM